MKHLLTLGALTLASLSAETLKEQLDARSAQASGKVPPEVRAEFAKGIQAVADAKVTEHAKQVGDSAPDFTLQNHQGQEVTLSQILSKGPVVLTWYRGGWCPYCNIALRALQKELPAIEAAGATLLALTPELPGKSAETIEKGALEFQVLTDLNHKVAKNYGLLFELTPEVTKLYKQFDNDLIEYNGTEAGDNILPLAATYVINTDGKITYAFLDANYRHRAEPSEIVDALKDLKN